MTRTKLYTLGQGNFVNMFRKSIGQRIELTRYSAHEYAECSKPSDAIRLYRSAPDRWRPGDYIFEVRDPQQITYGSRRDQNRMAAKSFIIVRELSSADVFGKHFPRAENLVITLDGRVTLQQVEQLFTLWEALPTGWEHCQCSDDDDNCPHEAAEGSRGSLADRESDAYTERTDDISESMSLLDGFARPIVMSYANAIWWYHAGQESLDISELAHWRCGAGTLGTLFRWQEETTSAIRGLIGAALLWPELSDADRAAWSQVTNAILSAREPG